MEGILKRNKLKKQFSEKCYAILRKVPRGRIMTYGEIAKAIGSPKSARAVGNAMNRNPYGFLNTANSRTRLRSHGKNELTVDRNPYAPRVPCHRVVRSDGKVGGFASGAAKKSKLLKEEGIKIKGGKIDLKKYLYKNLL